MFRSEEWFRLPLKLRQRWWQETDYGRLNPPPEFMAEMVRAIEEIRNDRHPMSCNE